jgi:phosphoribosylformylglycinamidine (FGAM) synthase-like enzyme
LRPGEADACVTGIFGTTVGVATSVDGNPHYCALDPYLGAVCAVCESMRNVAAVGAIPIALTDCLNFGNPEDPSVFRDFVETVRGIGDAARALSALGTDEPVAIVSGNVSFYNESNSGSAVPPSPIVACYGVLEDYSRSVSICLKRPGNDLVMVGRRRPGLGGSALLRALAGRDGGMLPELNLDDERRAIHAVTECILRGLVLACHDISDGGLAVALAEMVMGGWGQGRVGARVSMDALGGTHSAADLLFSESGGFVMEVSAGGAEVAVEVCSRLGAPALVIGGTVEEHGLGISRGGAPVIDLSGPELGQVWQNSLEEYIR